MFFKLYQGYICFRINSQNALGRRTKGSFQYKICTSYWIMQYDITCHPSFENLLRKSLKILKESFRRNQRVNLEEIREKKYVKKSANNDVWADWCVKCPGCERTVYPMDAITAADRNWTHFIPLPRLWSKYVLVQIFCPEK